MYTLIDAFNDMRYRFNQCGKTLNFGDDHDCLNWVSISFLEKTTATSVTRLPNN